MRLDKMHLSCEMEREFEWRKWCKEIPYIEWPAGWKVKAIPPTVGAVIRYNILIPNHEERISVYLDCYEMLGYYGKPYWEIYPYKGDTYRCDMENTEELVKAIGEAFDEKTT